MSDIHHVTSWPGILGICEWMRLHVFPFIVPWLKQTVGDRPKRGARMGRNGRNYEIQERKSCFNNFLSMFVAVIWVQCWERSSEKESTLIWREKWPPRGSGLQLLPYMRGTPTAHSTTLLLTFTALVAYCDKHAIDVISVIPRFYNRFRLIVIILWLTVWVLSEWCPLSLDAEGCDLESRVV